MNKRERLFFLLLSVYLYLSWVFFFLFLHFDVTVHSFLLFKMFNTIQDFSFIAPSFIKSSFSLFIMFFLFIILIFLLLSLYCFIKWWSLQTFLFHSFEISFCCDIRSLFLFPFTYSAFSICQSCFFFHSFKAYNHYHSSHYHREIRTNMHDKWIKWYANPDESLC